IGTPSPFNMKLCGAPGGDVRSPTKIRCGLDFYLNGRKIERFYVSLSRRQLSDLMGIKVL
ncbi:MAG: hypothetical protein PUF43_05110, partial [Bacteroidales bacterium]|nr:hypothetical protein [Bacteroidales bacterium]